ncbi:MAG TPA: SDR family oxidoreductase [Solimonas sp.]
MKGQRVFITGGASGLGRALAEHYARNGGRIGIGDLNDARGAETLSALRALGGEAFYIHCDVRSEADLISAREQMVEQFGGVDLLFNNAGVAQSGPIDETTMDDWQWIVDINLLGVVRGCRVFTPLLKTQGSGVIVNIASMAGLIHPPQMAAYNTTKAAVVALSETLKAELHRYGIQVSVVCPAFFRTNLHETQRATSAELDAFTRKLVGKAKVGPEEIANKIATGVAAGRFHILTHASERRIWLFKRFAPYSMYANAVIKRAEAVMHRKRPPAKP